MVCYYGHHCLCVCVPAGEMEDVRQKRRDLLHQYYGLREGEERMTVAAVRPIDIDSMHFNVDSYMDKMLQERSFMELLGAQKTFDEGRYVVRRMGTGAFSGPATPNHGRVCFCACT